MTRRLSVCLGTIGLALFAVTPAANAATFVAAPNGSGVTCTGAAPCSITTAIASANGGGGEVLATPGTYTMGTSTVALNNVALHGTPGATRPTIAFPNDPNAFFEMQGGSLADLDVIGGGNRAVRASGPINVQFERVALRCSTCTGATLNIDVAPATATVRDSLLTSSVGSTAVGVFTGSASLTGVTAINTSSTAGSAAVMAQANTNGTVQATVRNSILDGATDLAARPSGSGSSATVNLANSRYVTTDVTNTSSGPSGTIVNGGGNTTAQPTFVGAPDFHPLATSPTRDLGSSAAFTDPTAPGLDLDGVPRWFGPEPDMGAYEFPVSPTVDTPFATDVTASGATLVTTGVLPNVVAASTLRFDYGPSDAYGQTTSISLPAGGTSPATSTAAVSGLTPSTTYHVRAVLITPGGTATSGDRTFTTAAGPTTTPPDLTAAGPTTTPPDLTAPTVANLKLSSRSVRRGKTTAISFTLSDAAAVTIRVQAILPGRRKAKACVVPTQKLRKSKRCMRYVTKLTLNRHGTVGSNRITLSTSKLARGKYRVLVRATDVAGNRSRELSVPLRVS